VAGFSLERHQQFPQKYFPWKAVQTAIQISAEALLEKK